jgi:hypothetical protein
VSVAAEVVAAVDLWRKRVMRDLASGRSTSRLGVKSCRCGRDWVCYICGKQFRCWNTWPILWNIMPKRFRGTRLCRRCYGEILVRECKRERQGRRCR